MVRLTAKFDGGFDLVTPKTELWIHPLIFSSSKCRNQTQVFSERYITMNYESRTFLYAISNFKDRTKINRQMNPNYDGSGR